MVPTNDGRRVANSSTLRKRGSDVRPTCHDLLWAVGHVTNTELVVVADQRSQHGLLIAQVSLLISTLFVCLGRRLVDIFHFISTQA